MHSFRCILLLSISAQCIFANISKNLTDEYKIEPKKVAVKNDSEVFFENIENVLNFYNTEKIAKKWSGFKRKISKECRNDIGVYIAGLEKDENWALKMDDASGKYSTGWFWGNHYWTGSQNLCDHIHTRPKNFITDVENRSRIAKSTAKLPSTPTQLDVYHPNEPLTSTSSFSPYPVSFFMLKLQINLSITNEERILHMGLCLPLTCHNDDVKILFEETIKASSKVSVEVIKVRSQQNRYNMFHDVKFWLLTVVLIGTLSFIIIGTGFHYYLEHRMNKKVTTITQHYSVQALRSTNGKSGLYIVNRNQNSDENSNVCLPSIEASPPSTISSPNSVIKLIIKELLLSFSIKANAEAIFDQSVGSDTIPVLHGLKSISMAWVILGHTCIIAFKYSDNMEFRRVIQKEFLFQTISNGAYSVDTFFFVSGLLVSFLYFRTNAKGKLDPLSKGRNGFVAGALHFIGLISYRFARLTAPYLFMVGLTEIVMKWFYYNSIFEPPTMDHINCPKYWWRNMLYINTFFPVEEMCMLWSWYISDDTQFYAIGAIILILATRHFKSAVGLLTFFAISSWITTGYIAFSNNHVPGADDPLALFDKIYDKPWTRLGPYFVGMCAGWFLFKKDCRIRMSKITVIVGWSFTTALLLTLVYGLYEVKLTPVLGATYSALSHSAWALGLAWIVVACVTGYGGVINHILSAPVLYPFSRVTYCAYLVHPLIIRAMVMTMDSPLHLGTVVTLIIFSGQAVVSFILSFILSLIFEAPAVSMLRIISKIFVKKKTLEE